MIIPEFGGFVANYKPASVDYDRNIFSPPSKSIGFNSKLTHNDGLLISAVSLSNGLGYPDAKRNVENFVKEIKKKLEKGKKVSLEELGTFYIDRDQLLQFEPDRSKNYLIDSFGLSTFEFAELEEYDVRKKIQTKFRGRDIVKSSRNKKILRRTLIAIPVIAALVLIPLKTNLLNLNADSFSFIPFKNTEISETPPVSGLHEENQTLLVTDEQTPEIKNEIIEYEPEQDLTEDNKVTEPEVIEDKSEITESVPFKTQPVILTGSKYYIITGSFKNFDNASRLSESLLNEGYSSEILEAGNGFHRVGISGFSNFSEATRELNEFEKTHSGENYWILKK